jgi:hypothetical protein
MAVSEYFPSMLGFSFTIGPNREFLEKLLAERIAGSGGKIISTVHDKIILEAPGDKAVALAAILRNTLIEAWSPMVGAIKGWYPLNMNNQNALRYICF